MRYAKGGPACRQKTAERERILGRGLCWLMSALFAGCYIVCVPTQMPDQRLRSSFVAAPTQCSDEPEKSDIKDA
jgi:hypothetical protein